MIIYVLKKLRTNSQEVQKSNWDTACQGGDNLAQKSADELSNGLGEGFRQWTASQPVPNTSLLEDHEPIANQKPPRVKHAWTSACQKLS